MARQIIATDDTDKIVFTKFGEKMWVRDRYQNGMLVHSGRMNTNSVERELSILEGWTIEKIEK